MKSQHKSQVVKREVKGVEYTDREGTVWIIDNKGDCHFVKKLPRAYKDWFKKR